MIIFSQCMDCKNFIEENNEGEFFCKAYPKGIPKDIFWNKIMHDMNINGDKS
jgi:hypothetical protein